MENSKVETIEESIEKMEAVIKECEKIIGEYGEKGGHIFMKEIYSYHPFMLYGRTVAHKCTGLIYRLNKEIERQKEILNK